MGLQNLLERVFQYLVLRMGYSTRCVRLLSYISRDGVDTVHVCTGRSSTQVPLCDEALSDSPPFSIKLRLLYKLKEGLLSLPLAFRFTHPCVYSLFPLCTLLCVYSSTADFRGTHQCVYRSIFITLPIEWQFRGLVSLSFRYGNVGGFPYPRLPIHPSWIIYHLLKTHGCVSTPKRFISFSPPPQGKKRNFSLRIAIFSPKIALFPRTSSREPQKTGQVPIVFGQVPTIFPIILTHDVRFVKSPMNGRFLTTSTH